MIYPLTGMLSTMIPLGQVYVIGYTYQPFMLRFFFIRSNSYPHATLESENDTAGYC